MVRLREIYVLLQGYNYGSGILFTKFNGLPNHIMKRFISSISTDFLSVSDFVAKELTNSISGDIEFLCKLSYKEHHGEFYDCFLRIYKIRKPKCVNGLKNLEDTFGFRLGRKVKVMSELKQFLAMLSGAEMLPNYTCEDSQITYNGDVTDVVLVKVPLLENGSGITAVFHKGTESLVDINLDHVCSCGGHCHA